MENMSAYILKMAIDRMVISLDMPEMKEISSLLRYIVNVLEKRHSSAAKMRNDFVVIPDGRQPACVFRLVLATFFLASFAPLFKYVDYNENNINQIAKRLNSSQNIYASDIVDIQEKQTQITEMVRDMGSKHTQINF